MDDKIFKFYRDHSFIAHNCTSHPQRLGKNYLLIHDTNSAFANKKMVIDKKGFVVLKTETVNKSKDEPTVFGVAISTRGDRVNWIFHFKGHVIYIQQGSYITSGGSIRPINNSHFDSEYVKFF